MRDEFPDYFRMMDLHEKRQDTFEDAGALYHYRFDQDNGKVPQIAQAKQYADHWKEVSVNSLGLLFWGPPGTGKTFAAACIANALLEIKDIHEPTVRMTTFAQILNALPAMTAQDKERYLKKLLDCDLLILDDFGMERQTEYAREQIFHIVDGRYLRRKPLIVTTNLSLKELKKTSDMAQQRICDRILELCIPVYFGGESLRQEKARENMRLYKQLTGQTASSPLP